MQLLLADWPACEPPPLQVPGGDPLQLSGNITLCARPDLEPTRFLSGSLAGLMLWGEGLGPGQVAALYRDTLFDAVANPLGVRTGGCLGWWLAGVVVFRLGECDTTRCPCLPAAPSRPSRRDCARLMLSDTAILLYVGNIHMQHQTVRS